MDWFYGFIGKPKGKAREYFNKSLALIPIKKIPETEQETYITLVDKILAAKKSPPAPLSEGGSENQTNIPALEAEIDRLVYSLYGLTDEEIAVVKGKR